MSIFEPLMTGGSSGLCSWQLLC